MHISAFTSMPNVKLVAMCDVDQSVVRARLKDIESSGKEKPVCYTDARKLLEDKSIDAIFIATPHHQHTLQTIWACQAGKDVFVEKPCSHTMFEGRQIVAAARKYDRIVQVGTQSRSSNALQEAVTKMGEGLIGDVYMARGLCFKRRDTIGHAPEEPAPAEVDYDLWLGPAPRRPFTRNRFHYNWHWMWDYGDGDLGNQGTHEMDIARWGLGVRYPTKISAIGGHFMFDDDQETPNTVCCTYEFDDGGKKRILVFEVRHWISNHEVGIRDPLDVPSPTTDLNTIGNVFYGSKGYLAVEGYTSYKSYLGQNQEPGPAATSPRPDVAHYSNFINTVRSQKRTDLNADIEEGAISASLIQLAHISYRLGRSLHFDEKAFTCTGDVEATRMFTYDYRPPFIVPKLV
jgi:predicted dehydrogenase